MYRRVLLPLDGSRESEETFGMIREELEPGAEVILLQVIPPARTQRFGGHIIMGVQQEEADRIESLGYLRAVSRRLSGTGGDGGPGNWRCEVSVSDSVSDGIVNAARSGSADLIAMYTHDRKLLARHVKTSIAKEVQRKADIDVRVFWSHELEGYAHGDRTAAADTAFDFRILKQVDVFRDLSDDQLAKVAAIGATTTVSAGDNLGLGGESGDQLYVILEGEAHLTTHSEVGEISVRIALPGEAFPLATLLGSGTLVTSGRALTDMQVLAIPRSELLDLCYREPELGIRVYASVGRLFSNRYAETLAHVAIVAERELRESNA